MKQSFILFFIAFFLFDFFTFTTLHSQNTKSEIIEFSDLVEFETIVKNIEQKHKIKFYFKPEWFSNKKFRSSLTELPLTESIEVINRLSNLTCLTLNETDYVFVPVEIRNYTDRTDRRGVILIGEPINSDENENAEVYGKILDFKTGKPLDGARLSIDKLNLNTTSDKNGNYKLSLPPGDYDLAINFVGYEEDYRKIRVFGTGIVNFEISEKIIRLNEITVTNKAPDLNLLQVQMSSIQFNSKIIKELPGFLGVKDVIKSVTLLPGIQSTGEFGTGTFRKRSDFQFIPSFRTTFSNQFRCSFQR